MLQFQSESFAWKFSHLHTKLQAQTRLNKLGLMLSWSTRVTLQESIHTMSEKLIADKLKKNPLVKVTGKIYLITVCQIVLNHSMLMNQCHCWMTHYTLCTMKSVLKHSANFKETWQE